MNTHGYHYFYTRLSRVRERCVGGTGLVRLDVGELTAITAEHVTLVEAVCVTSYRSLVGRASR
jgi:hypothetical protein